MLKLPLLFTLAFGYAFAQSANPNLLSNEDIVRLSQAGMSEDVMVSMVTTQPGQYRVSPNDLLSLKQAKVSDKIIAAMVNRGSINPIVGNAIPSNFVLQDGTPVRLRLKNNLSSADAHTGDSVDFEVVEDVEVNNLLAIPRGSTAIATVTEAEAKRRMARGGKLDINIDYVRLASGEKASLRGVKATSGGGHTGAMTGAIVATSLVMWPAAPFFLFMHGKDTTILKGTEITAFVSGDLKLNPVRFSAAATAQTDSRPSRPVGGAMAATSSVPEPPGPAATPNPAGSREITSVPKEITIRFISTPGTAEVTVDGAFIASTPSSDYKRLKEGTHSIMIRKIGYKTWERKIDLLAGDEVTVNAQLELDPTKPQVAGND